MKESAKSPADLIGANIQLIGGIQPISVDQEHGLFNYAKTRAEDYERANLHGAWIDGHNGQDVKEQRHRTTSDHHQHWQEIQRLPCKTMCNGLPSSRRYTDGTGMPLKERGMSDIWTSTSTFGRPPSACMGPVDIDDKRTLGGLKRADAGLSWGKSAIDRLSMASARTDCGGRTPLFVA